MNDLKLSTEAELWLKLLESLPVSPELTETGRTCREIFVKTHPEIGDFVCEKLPNVGDDLEKNFIKDGIQKLFSHKSQAFAAVLAFIAVTIVKDGIAEFCAHRKKESAPPPKSPATTFGRRAIVSPFPPIGSDEPEPLEPALLIDHVAAEGSAPDSPHPGWKKFFEAIGVGVFELVVATGGEVPPLPSVPAISVVLVPAAQATNNPPTPSMSSEVTLAIAKEIYGAVYDYLLDKTLEAVYAKGGGLIQRLWHTREKDAR